MTVADSHFSPEEAALYLRREMDGERSLGLEAHATQCPSCAGLLQDQAVLDAQLFELAAQLTPPRRTGRRMAQWGLVGALALAASLLLFLGLRARHFTTGGDRHLAGQMAPQQLRRVDRVVACLSSRDPAACQREKAASQEPPASAGRAGESIPKDEWHR